MLGISALAFVSVATGLVPGLKAGDLAELGRAVEIASEVSQESTIYLQMLNIYFKHLPSVFVGNTIRSCNPPLRWKHAEIVQNGAISFQIIASWL